MLSVEVKRKTLKLIKSQRIEKLYFSLFCIIVTKFLLSFNNRDLNIKINLATRNIQIP